MMQAPQAKNVAGLAAQFDALHVSRETQARLQIYVDLLCKWQPRINLISSQTLPDIWQRHIVDSLQLLSLLASGGADKLPSNPLRIMDIGTGAGLPGLILALATDHDIHLVESDQRKCAFLRTALRETGRQAVIHNQRIETCADLQADLITARALASVDDLLTLTKAQHRAGLRCLFLKGRNLTSELTILSDWPTVDWQCHASLTDEDAQILDLRFL